MNDLQQLKKETPLDGVRIKNYSLTFVKIFYAC